MIYYNYSQTQLESLADNLNMEFDAERLKIPKPIDVYDVVEYLGATPDWIYITPDQSILGATFFCDTYWYSWPEARFDKNILPIEIPIRKGTILIDRTLNEGKDRGKENHTVIHECFHYKIHERCFRREDGFQHYCKKDAFDPWGNRRRPMSALEINEYQANYCAAAFLMPKTAVENAFIKSIRMTHKPEQPLPYADWMKKYIAELAKEFSVNFNPMKYRLQQLKLIEKEQYR